MRTKTERQLEVVNKWFDTNMIGTLVAVTGFGKTFTVILAIKEFYKRYNYYPITVVVVPTLILKDQWTIELAKNKISATVLVINTASKTNLECDLLVIDEVHTAGAETFKLVFETIKYKYIFNLTATIERQDGMEKLLLKKAPIIDEIGFEECRKNGWISEFVIYNLETPFTSEELANYKKADSTFRYFAMQLGFGGESFKVAQQWLKNGDSKQKGQAIAYFASIRKRKDVITNNSGKLLNTLNIINKFNDENIIVFSEAINFADNLRDLLPDITVSIHSKMIKKKQQEALNQFKDRRTNKRVIASVKALTAGLDLPQLSVGIIASFNSAKLTNTQTIGRIIRPLENKQAKIFNLYTPDSQEVNWLKKKQDGQLGIKWIKSLNEI